MLDMKFVRENEAAVRRAIELKREKINLDEVLELDRKLVTFKSEVQELQTKRNAHSKKIPAASAAERPSLIEEGKKIGSELDALKPKLTEMEDSLQSMLLRLPQVPHPDAPVGPDESGNVEVKKGGTLPQFSFKALDHVEILERHAWADFERIGNVSGSRSYSLRNEMVITELAIHRLAMDVLLEKGFNLVSVPAFARESALIGTGHFPNGRDQVYFLPEDDLYLSGTAEVQINSLHAGDILSEDQLPMLYAGYSPCFRREAGSYGRDVRGLMRVHQFMKVEQYILCKNDPTESEKWHEMLLQTSEEIVKMLELPYRVVECCTGDMGTGKVRMYDVECWVPSENRYRETHSCSALHDWQARRTNTRYRDSDGTVKHVFTLNNTAIATPRVLVPFLECHQQEDGTVKVPKALQTYLGGRTVLGKKG